MNTGRVPLTHVIAAMLVMLGVLAICAVAPWFGAVHQHSPTAPPAPPEPMKVIHCTAGLADTADVNSLPATGWIMAAHTPTFQTGTKMFHVPEGYTCEVMPAP